MASTERLGLESELLEPGGALEHADELRLDPGKVGRYRLQRLHGAGQRFAVLGLDIVVGLPRQHIGNAGRGYEGEDNQNGERADQAQHRRLAASEARAKRRA